MLRRWLLSRGNKEHSMSDYDLILAGAGHAHLGVLRRWALVARPKGRIALLNSAPHAWYSGRLSGLVAGRWALGGR